MRRLIALCLFAVVGWAQPQLSEAEQSALRQALAEAGNSPVDFARALERHLEKYPNSPRKADLEGALAKAAVENKDNRRIVLYGEKVLAREMDDPQLLESVSRALLLGSDDKARSERALKYSRRLQEILKSMRGEKHEPGSVDARSLEEMDRMLGKALVYQARATGNLGKMEEAVALARSSYEACPTSEPAREMARWLLRLGRPGEALPRLADAFMIQDAARSDAERAADRARLGEVYLKLKGSETGLGDVVLEAYDRTTIVLNERRMKFRAYDPNLQVTNPLEFTLTGLQGDKLALASLKGKVVVLDFWATWCGPCRAQHPLYEQVKQRFRGREDVVFLSVDTDEDHTAVEPFLDELKWSKKVYFEDGLSHALRVSSIPTTIIFNRRGEVVSRMNGYIPERFVDMLSDRIRDTLKE
jgi:thiol-disulfide isomerase/thioredoxin